MTVGEVWESVESYISSDEFERGQKYLNHNGQSGFPGPDWMNFCFKRNNLFLKEVTKLSSARYNTTKNPFLVFHYFELLEEAIKKS